MKNNKIVNGIVSSHHTEAFAGSMIRTGLGFKVNCGYCGNKCTFTPDPDFAKFVNSDDDGKSEKDRVRLNVHYKIEHLWKCSECGAQVDISSESTKVIEFVKKYRPDVSLF